MKDTCRISVVIPAYNRETTIKYCVTSVLNQTFPPFEVIVVDDCSTDNTLKVLQEIESPDLYYFKLEKNSGAQAARNLGVKLAKGEWIAFHDSDDEWLPDKLEKQVKALAAAQFNPFTVVHGNCFRMFANTNSKQLWEIPIVAGNNVLSLLLREPAPLFPAIVTSKKAIEQIGYLDEHVPSYQEWDTSIRLAHRCQFIYINEPLFIYHLHGNETISKNIKRDITGYQYVINKHKDSIIDTCGEDAFFKQINYNLARSMNAGLWNIASEILQHYYEFKSHSIKSRILSFLVFLKVKPKNLSFFTNFGRIKLS